MDGVLGTIPHTPANERVKYGATTIVNGLFSAVVSIGVLGH